MSNVVNEVETIVSKSVVAVEKEAGLLVNEVKNLVSEVGAFLHHSGSNKHEHSGSVVSGSTTVSGLVSVSGSV